MKPRLLSILGCKAGAIAKPGKKPGCKWEGGLSSISLEHLAGVISPGLATEQVTEMAVKVGFKDSLGNREVVFTLVA